VALVCHTFVTGVAFRSICNIFALRYTWFIAKMQKNFWQKKAAKNRVFAAFLTENEAFY